VSVRKKNENENNNKNVSNDPKKERKKKRHDSRKRVTEVAIRGNIMSVREFYVCEAKKENVAQYVGISWVRHVSVFSPVF
jgi:hypothetical protein